MDLGYGLFMAERAGLLNTKESRLNRACSQIKRAGVHINHPDDAEQILAQNKLQFSELTHSEQQRVLDCLRR